MLCIKHRLNPDNYDEDDDDDGSYYSDDSSSSDYGPPTCRECTVPGSDGFQCSGDVTSRHHVACRFCQTLMPRRDPAGCARKQQCFSLSFALSLSLIFDTHIHTHIGDICATFMCDKYYGTGCLAGPHAALKELTSWQLNSMPVGALNNNSVEH